MCRPKRVSSRQLLEEAVANQMKLLAGQERVFTMLQEILDGLKAETDATDALASGPVAEIAAGVASLIGASDLTPIKTALDAKAAADANLATAINAVVAQLPAAPVAPAATDAAPPTTE